MKYMGSKNRIAKHILPFIQKELKNKDIYIEPFVGGANMIDKVIAPVKQGYDSNRYLIGLLKSIQNGYVPDKISKEEYIDIKSNKRAYNDYIVGWAGIGCSYSGKWFGGYAGKTETKGGIRDYQQEAIKNLLKQKEGLVGVSFDNKRFEDLDLSESMPAVIYCDPPYEGTTQYKDDFDHKKFGTKCEEGIKQGHTVFVSEYNAPDGGECVGSQEVKSSLSANGKSGGSKNSIEKLFIKKE